MHYWLGKLKPLKKLLESLHMLTVSQKKVSTKPGKIVNDEPPTYSDRVVPLDNDNPDLVAAAKAVDDAKEIAREAARALADAERYLRKAQREREDDGNP